VNRARDLVLVGAGGFARETAEAVRAINLVRPTWRLLGFLDDDPRRRGASVDGLAVLGPIELARGLGDASFVVCTGRPDDYLSRRRIVRRLGLDEGRFATIIHPSAAVGPTSLVGPGSVLLAHVTLTTSVRVGRHVAVMPQVVLTHDTRVCDFSTLASGVRTGGGCTIDEEAYLGSGALLRERVTVGARALIGMGAVVTRDVPAERLWYGHPARDRGPAPLCLDARGLGLDPFARPAPPPQLAP
jgi:sugar O-acyltransferase (sialic acid O-acetyltransferase NeuD family)